VKPEDTTKMPTGLDLYLKAAESSASVVIRNYSTSFGLASKLLAQPIRQHVENIYALVRVADEIVDGAAEEARTAGGTVAPAKSLDELEAETYRALTEQFSTNLVVHAFAHTANVTGFGRELIEPFFASMRMDLTEVEHDQESFERYVYGSAEVVGLMCLQAFLVGKTYTDTDKERMVAGARALGAAFQKVNFLRDLSADSDKLGRSYFPGIVPEELTEKQKRELVADIENDLKISARAMPLLPREARRAVAAAHLLFEELNVRIGNTPAAKVITSRISVPNTRKALILLKALIGVLPK
jgi:phytoene/squalene synthetase